jgi:hypothetical protein
MTALSPLPPHSHDRHRMLDDFRKPVRVLRPVTGGWSSHSASVSPSLSTGTPATGNILKGVRPADLPVQQSNKFEHDSLTRDRPCLVSRSRPNVMPSC